LCRCYCCFCAPACAFAPAALTTLSLRQSILEALTPIIAEKDSHGNTQLGGTGALGDALMGLIKERLKCRCRADTYGFLQRSFPADTSEVHIRIPHAVVNF